MNHMGVDPVTHSLCMRHFVHVTYFSFWFCSCIVLYTYLYYDADVVLYFLVSMWLFCAFTLPYTLINKVLTLLISWDPSNGFLKSQSASTVVMLCRCLVHLYRATAHGLCLETYYTRESAFDSNPILLEYWPHIQ